ncbi:MAG: prepilin-type N-terminal cleavage/methylation domain-containing protein [Deltaproteobacteria bacterium]|jgi:prepilin-type N-terminal cleavage/methylation domain-containing protein|nr:prepilin-type N-terminal cleavage/methylation domain-containing protein [Deltaproteobacteria bacterium]MDA8305640.1 prepilin-type N-terminal cleavage/methylation domain-containing protein [Deltaproteobacteria bacterium]
MNDKRGMTMVELMVSLAIVLLIVATATTAYYKLLLSYKSNGSTSESYMSNLTGFELLRYDIEMAGFGLPTNLSAGVSYTEAASGHYDGDANLPDPSTLNDATSGAPRAFVMIKNLNANNSDILAIKSTLANLSATSKKWSMITEEPSELCPTAGVAKVKLWGVTGLDPVMDFTSGPPTDNFIVLDNYGTLQTTGGGTCANHEPWCYSFNASAGNLGYYSNASNIVPGTFGPSSVYYIYGLDNSTGPHVMPFNRVDYFLGPTTNPSCAPNTWTLFRGAVNQADGTISPSVLVDCVEDFQVAFGVDPTGNGIVWQADLNQENIPGGAGAGVAMTAAQIQQYLREVRVYTIYQEGAGKISRSPQFKFLGTFSPGADIGLTLNNSWTPSGQDIYYHWKLTELDVKPMNLVNLPYDTWR